MRFIENCKHIFKCLYVDKEIARFINHNKKVWQKWRCSQNSPVILVDLYEVGETIISWSYFVNILAKKYHAKIMSFAPPKKLTNLTLRKVYDSFNVTGHIVTTLTQEQKNRRDTLSREIMPGIKTKQDLYNLTVSDTWIGIDIYETYLSRFNKPTIYLDDQNLIDLIVEGIGLVIFWQDYFSQNKVAAVIVSHDCYMAYNILCKIAYRAQIPVYLPNIRGIWLVNKPLSVHSFFSNYREMFKKLPKNEQHKGLALARQQIEKRLNGAVGVDMPYSTKSGFGPANDKVTVLKESDKIKVLICSHCFYDNPHGYGGMIFTDFYEWLVFLGQMSEKTDYDWYLKIHPDPLPGTYDIIEEILSKFSKIVVIPHETSHHQLVKEGINFVLTCFGTVGHEYPVLGVQVINAAFNPHIAYNFNWHPKSIEEYEHYLLNLGRLEKEIDINELYEFYYMNYYYVPADDLFLRSHKESLNDPYVKQKVRSGIYRYFLDQLTEEKHQEIINNIQKYIESGKSHYFSRGPE